MNTEAKIIAGILGASVLIVIGAAVINGGGAKTQSPAASQSVPTQEIQGLTSSPQPFTLGNVPINSGVAKFSFKLLNENNQPLKLIRISTSCMCTLAAVRAGETKTDYFGMDMHGAGNPKIDFTIPAGSESELLVTFDPAAHGPQGVGAFDRSIRLEFSDPAGYKDI